MNEHYVYLYIDPRDARVFYVGCGKGRRMWVHLRPSVLKVESLKNKLIAEILQEDLHPTIAVIEWGLSQSESLNRERAWIAFYGKDNLTNKTTGGQGVPGTKSFLGRHHTEAAKERIRQSKIGSKNPMFGKQRTAEALRKFSEKMRGEGHPQWGQSRSETTKEKIRAKLSGFQWNDEECVKRSIGMSRVWDERRKTGVIPKHLKRVLTVGGITKSLDEWSEQAGIKKSTLRARLSRGWRLEDAVGV